MNALAQQVVSQLAPDLLVLASPDRDWRGRIEAAFQHAAPGLPPQFVCIDDVSALAGSSCGSGVWLIDDAWLPAFLADHPVAPDFDPAPKLVVRFEHLCSEGVFSAIGVGVRGCLSIDAAPEEVLQAVRAVRAGELWLSRKLFAEVLTHLLAQVQVHAAVHRHEEGGERMTERQREIAACVARGMSNKQIGRQLGISPTTVKTHLHNIFERVGVGGRTLLALRAMDVENR